MDELILDPLKMSVLKVGDFKWLAFLVISIFFHANFFIGKLRSRSVDCRHFEAFILWDHNFLFFQKLYIWQNFGVQFFSKKIIFWFFALFVSWWLLRSENSKCPPRPLNQMVDERQNLWRSELRLFWFSGRDGHF